jgi:hypothetical protein
MDQDHIITDVWILDGADLRVSGTGIKGNGKDQLVPGLQIRGKIESIQKSMDFLVRKGLDQNLSFPLPIDPCGGVCDDIFLGVGKLEKSPKTFQNAIDIARGKIFANQILDILFDVRWTNCLQLCQLFVLFQLVKE